MKQTNTSIINKH